MRTRGIFRVGRSLVITSVIMVLMLTAVPLLGGSQAASSDALYITGKVTDANGDPIPGAKVALENESFVLTDAKGNFTIPASTGNHTLTISFSGASTKTVSVTLSSESEDIGTVELLPEPVDQTLVYASIVLAIVVAAILLFYIYWGGKKQDEEERKAKEKK
jgi:multisubunit Na+/H+ antiporter MnhC subunit